MVYIELEDIKVNKVDDEVKIEIVNNEIKESIAEEYFNDFLENSNIKSLENAILLTSKDYIKNFIIEKVNNNILTRTYIDDSFCFEILNNLDIIEKVLEISLKEKIRETIKSRETELKPYLLIKVFEKFNYSEEEIKKITSEIIDKSYLSTTIEYFVELKKLYPQLTSLLLDEHIDKILNNLKEEYWEDFYKGRGYYFDIAKNLFLEFSQLKDLLNDESKKKIQKFLLSNNVEKIITRRIKKANHIDCIKVILDFLPDEIKGKYLVYFL
jgi:hypothetical protein